MTLRCSNPTCFVHEGESCPLGSLRTEDCSSWREPSTDPGPGQPHEDVHSSRVPWSGAALGLADLPLLTPRSQPSLIGMIGAHDAGKSTLLTGAYLMMLRGHRAAGASFAGSRTLGAWESLAAWARFDDAARTPSFPPHTPRGVGRVPGLLHLAWRTHDERLRDVLLTDAPGEWFTRWAIREDDPEADGARWIARHAHGFLLLVDCARLAGSDRGEARRETRSIIERLGNHVAGRPVVLVWAKSDHPVPDGIRRAILDASRAQLPHATEAESNIEQPETLLRALSTIVEACRAPHRCALIEPPVIVPNDPFGAFRGHHGHD